MTWLRWFLATLGSFVSLWLLLFAMPLSALYCGSLAILLAPTARLKKSSTARGAMLLLLLLAPLAAWNLGWTEFGSESVRLACISRDAHGIQESWCEDIDYPRRAPSSSGAIYSWRETQAIRSLNVLMATGGTFLHFPEVAGETLALDAGGRTPPDILDLPLRARRKLCRVGGISPTEERVGKSDFPMASLRVRAAAALLASRARGRELKPGQSVDLGRAKISWKTGKRGNNDTYTELLRHDSLRVALALLVPDGRLEGTAREEEGRVLLDFTWSGSIFYPPNSAFVANIPTFFGTRRVLVDEGMFCGLQMDGVFTPYRQTWQWRIQLDDPRLVPSQGAEADHTWFEKLLLAVL